MAQPLRVEKPQAEVRGSDLTAVAERHVEGIVPLAPEDVLRAQVYRLLARALNAPPSTDDLALYAALTGDGTEFGVAIGTFARAASDARPPDLARQYHDLVIGVGRGELVPFASYYLTGFLQERPLAQLRRDLARLGIGRDGASSDPEDHAAAILAAFAGLIDGAFGAPLPLAEQRDFYDRHVRSWLPVFFRDLAAVPSSEFYAALGAVGGAFLTVEDSAFEMI